MSKLFLHLGQLFGFELEMVFKFSLAQNQQICDYKVTILGDERILETEERDEKSL